MINSRSSNFFIRFCGVSTFTILTFIASYSPYLPANSHRAQAQVGGAVTEVGANLVVNTATSKAALESSLYDSVIRPMLDGLAWTAAKTAIQSLTQSTVNWINTGFEGSPAYVTDLNRNLSQLADTVADDFIRQLDIIAVGNTGISIRAPFQDQIAAQLREEFYRTTSSYGFDVRNPYTLGNSSNNPAAFTRGDFNQGGIDALYAVSKPENNPYGRYMLARNELMQQLDNQVEARVNELQWGNGFLSWRGSCGPNGASATPPGFGNTPVDLTAKDNTVGCSIRTPGSIIEDQLAGSLGSPIRQLELADSVNEIVSALMGQLVSQVLGGTGLTGVSRPSSGGGQSYLDRATNPSQYSGANGSLADGFSQEVAKQRQSIQDYRTNWQRIAGAASSAEQSCRNRNGASEARRVLDLANANISRATNAITTITALEGRITAARNSTSNQGANISAVVSEYQALLSGNGIPSSVDTDRARADAEDTGTANPGSLYSQMQRLASSCR